MKIIEAISLSIRDIGRPATYKEIYDHIIANKYFNFGAQSPISVVRVKLRLHSDNVMINSGRNKTKYFHSEGGEGIDEKFSVLNEPLVRDTKIGYGIKNTSKVIANDTRTVIKKDNIIKTVELWIKKQDFSIHKTSLLECFWMLLGSLLPILVDSLLRLVLLDINFIDAIKQNMKSGEIFLLTSALIMPFCFVLINYINSDDENKRINKLPYFGWVFFLTVISLLAGIFTFVYYRIGQLVRDKAQSDVVKSMFGFEFGGWAFFIFIMSLLIWYYSSYMNHRSTDTYKKIRKNQQVKLSQGFDNIQDMESK